MRAKQERSTLRLAVLVVFGIAIAILPFHMRGSGASSLPVRAYSPELAADSVGPPPVPTPTHSPVPAATATPVPVNTPLPSTSVTAGHSSYYTDSIGIIHILGDVKNGLSTPVSFAQVTAKLSSAGTLVASETGFANVLTIPAGGTSPFEILVTNSPTFDSVDVTVTDYHVTGDFDPPVVAGLTVTVGAVRTDSIGIVHVPVTVKNDSTSSWDFVQPMLGFYDAQGELVLLGNTFTQPTTLGPGDSGTSEFLFTSDYSPQISTSQTWVTADPSSAAATPTSTTPASAVTAICRDGAYSYSAHRSGTCSDHGGVATWVNYPLS